MLATTAWISICVAIVCAFWIAADELRHAQGTGVMNRVCPVTALSSASSRHGAYCVMGRKV